MGALKNKDINADFTFVEALEQEMDSEQQKRDERITRIAATRDQWDRAYGARQCASFTMDQVDDLLNEIEQLRCDIDDERFTHG